MVAMTKFDNFPRQILEGNHDLAAAADTLGMYLSNTAPSSSLDNAKADIAEIATGNGYTGSVAVNPSLTESTGTAGIWYAAVTPTTQAWTATGGAIAAFQYVVAFNNDTATPGDLYADALVGAWDYGSAVTLASGNSFTVDWTNNRILQLS